MTGKHFTFFLALLLPFTAVFGQADRYAGSPLKFGENKGQWDERVRYRADLGAGYLFLEDTALTYFFRHPEDLEAIHEWHHHSEAPAEGYVTVRNHAFRVALEGASRQPTLSGQALRSDYENYYLGSDRSRWASRVRQFREVFYADVYPNIDFRIYGRGPDLKYDFLVRPGGRPEVIRLAYTGVDRLKLSGGRLHITTSMGTMVEARPYIYQDVNGQRKAVKGRFALDGHTVSFKITGKYDPARPLIIDPTLIFSTYTGSASDNWGYTASYDEAGNAYGGGIIINDPNGQYPVSLGAFQTTYGGGEGSFSTQCDISIVKYSSDGSNLEYSTYLGGSGNESPHSLVVNNDNELYVLGTTSSSNYPTTVNAYDTIFGGGPLAIVNSIQYTGSDIIVTKFDSNGTALLGSTYMGGTNNDGLNDAVNPTQGLFMNYGDQFRGEIIVDSLGNAYVATVTAST
ncbi:MAG: hypothetical protein AAGB22_02015, partial [Bacteroidota bacterium]